MISDDTRRKWSSRIRVLLTRQDELSDWELGFIESISDRRDNGEDLTFNQSLKLNQIFNKIGG